MLVLEKIVLSYQRLAVASGDGVFLPLYQKMKEAHKPVEIFAFPGSINVEIPNTVSRVDYLQADILLGDFQTLKVLKEPDAEG